MTGPGSAPRRHRIVVPDPGRVRRIRGTTFGWIDARLHRDGWLRALMLEDLAVYVFLCLAADRQGVSFYRRERLTRELGLDDIAVHQALDRLCRRGLVAYRPFHPGAADGFHQVLALPPGGPPLAPPEVEHLLDTIG